MADSSWAKVIRQFAIQEEILQERDRQDEKFGEQWDVPLVADPDDHIAWKFSADEWKRINGATACDGMSMLMEEVAEAGAESDPQLMRGELIQVLAVAMKMVEKIDREAGK